MTDQPGNDRYSPINGTASFVGKRCAAIVSALIDARYDELSARFDTEVAKAVAEGRMDADTARTLRWWQRASVRAAENYVATVVPGALAVRDQAEAQAKSDADETAASWQRAVELAVAGTAGRAEVTPQPVIPEPPPTATTDTIDAAGEPAVSPPKAATLSAPPKAATRLTVVPDVPTTPGTSAAQATASKTRVSDQTRRAIRAAFTPQESESTATTVTIEGKDLRGHANPATTA